MERDPETPSQKLIEHPTREIDRFLNDMDLEPAWMGIIGGPHYEGDGEIVVSYNVRVIDGPYQDVISADIDYRYDSESPFTAEEIYPLQVTAIEAAFPEATVQCYIPNSWQFDRS